jgi:hypothetical protein
MLASEKIAIAAHLHVLLRRKTGRVTDTEWMAQNAEYGAEIVRYARAKASEDGHPDLAEWAGKLEQALQAAPAPTRPLAQAALQSLRERHAAAAPLPAVREAGDGPPIETSADAPGAGTAREPAAPRYVGGIR